jgi:hypothetical protein
LTKRALPRGDTLHEKKMTTATAVYYYRRFTAAAV